MAARNVTIGQQDLWLLVKSVFIRFSPVITRATLSDLEYFTMSRSNQLSFIVMSCSLLGAYGGSFNAHIVTWFKIHHVYC